MTSTVTRKDHRVDRVSGLISDKKPPLPKLHQISEIWEKEPMYYHFSPSNNRRTMLLTLTHSENKSGDIYTFDLTKMAHALGTKACETEYIVVGYERELIKMAVKMKSQVPAKRIIKKIYSFFGEYTGEIAFCGEDTRTYLEKAASIVAPLEARDVDPVPLVFGDKTLKDLLHRIDNARRGQRATKKVA